MGRGRVRVGDGDARRDGGPERGLLRGHSPRTRPATGSGAAVRSSRDRRQLPHGPRRRRLPPWRDLCLLSVCPAGLPCPRLPGAAAEAADATDAAAAAATSRERASAAAGARGAGPSQRPRLGPRAGVLSPALHPFRSQSPARQSLRWGHSLQRQSEVSMGFRGGQETVRTELRFYHRQEHRQKDKPIITPLF